MRKEELFRTLVNIDDNYIDEAENYKPPKINSKFMLYIGIVASLLVVAGVVVLATNLNNDVASIEETEIETHLTPTEAGIEGSDAIHIINETYNAADDHISMLHYVGDAVPEGSVAVFMYPTNSVHLQGHEGWYAPDNQDDWKASINKAVDRAQDKEYDVFPDKDMMPIYFLWIHEGFKDRWRLAYDGSLWGERLNLDEWDSEPFKRNYIAPEDAVEVAAMLIQVYDFFGINPIKPEQICDITYAELSVKGKTYTLDDKDKLGYLESTLKNAKTVGASGCPWATLSLVRKDGTVISIALAYDGCAAWHSDGIHYKYGDPKTAESIFSLFGIDLSKIPDL